MSLPPIQLTFNEPEILHPKSDEISTAEVAMFLEAKYHLCEKFYHFIQKKLWEKIVKALLYIQVGNKQHQQQQVFQIEEWLNVEFRDWLVSNKTGIITRAALLRDGVSFVDTGAYFSSMRLKLVGVF